MVHGKRLKQRVTYTHWLSNQQQLTSIIVHGWPLAPCHRRGLRAASTLIVTMSFLVPFYWCVLLDPRQHIVCVRFVAYFLFVLWYRPSQCKVKTQKQSASLHLDCTEMDMYQSGPNPKLLLCKVCDREAFGIVVNLVGCYKRLPV